MFAAHATHFRMHAFPADFYQPYLGGASCQQCPTTPPRYTSLPGSDSCLVPWVDTTCGNGEAAAALRLAAVRGWAKPLQRRPDARRSLLRRAPLPAPFASFVQARSMTRTRSSVWIARPATPAMPPTRRPVWPGERWRWGRTPLPALPAPPPCATRLPLAADSSSCHSGGTVSGAPCLSTHTLPPRALAQPPWLLLACGCHQLLHLPLQPVLARVGAGRALLPWPLHCVPHRQRGGCVCRQCLGGGPAGVHQLLALVSASGQGRRP